MIQIINKQDYFKTNRLNLENSLQDVSYLNKISSTNIIKLPFYGEIELEFIENAQRFSTRFPGYYINALIAITEALKNFLLDKTGIKLERNYIYKSVYDKEYDLYLYLINNLEIDGYFYFYFHNTFNEWGYPQNQYGILGENGDKPYIGHQNLMDEIFRRQQIFESDTELMETLKKQHSYDNVVLYYKAIQKDFLIDFIECFENNITDIPANSLLWQTSLLKETMTNFNKLKTYAKEQGWTQQSSS